MPEPTDNATEQPYDQDESETPRKTESAALHRCDLCDTVASDREAHIVDEHDLPEIAEALMQEVDSEEAFDTITEGCT